MAIMIFCFMRITTASGDDDDDDHALVDDKIIIIIMIMVGLKLYLYRDDVQRAREEWCSAN